MSQNVRKIKESNLLERYKNLSQSQINNATECEVIEMLPSVVNQTKYFISKMDPSQFNVLKEIRKYYIIFYDSIKAYESSNEELSKQMKQLGDCWKRINILFKFEDNTYKKRSDVATWFKQNTAQLFLNKSKFTEITINEILVKVEANADVAELLAKIVFEAIEIVMKKKEIDLMEWKKKLYLYERSSKCCVVFFTNECFIDQYGNFYMNEEHFVKCLQRKNECLTVTVLEGNREAQIEAASYNNTKILEATQQSFKNYEKSFAFENFIKDCGSETNKAVEAFFNIKIFSYFFRIIDQKFGKHRIFFGIDKISYNCQIVFYNMDGIYIITSDLIYNIHTFKRELEKVNIQEVSQIPSFDVIIQNLTEKGSILEYQQEDIRQYENDLNCYSYFEENHKTFKDICHLITSKMINYLETDPEYGSKIFQSKISLSELKFVVLWVAETYKNESDALINFKLEEQIVEEGYCQLLIAGETSLKMFENKYCAAYHFCKHYGSLKNTFNDPIINKNELKDLPEVYYGNEFQCAVEHYHYLSKLILQENAGYAWTTLLNYIKKRPRFGFYVVMIEYVFTLFLQIAPIFIMILVPFVVLFYVRLGKGEGIFAFCDTFINTLVIMMTGEFNYRGLISSKDSVVTFTIFCLFIFIVTIFLNNLLIGLAVRKISQIETIPHVEMTMPERLRKKEPKEVSEIEKETHRFTPPGFRRLFEWWGMSKDAAKRIDNTNPLEDKLAALDQKLDQSINNLNEKMNDIIELLKRI